jgi:phosphoglycerol transferase MdoB-like AlkP superfamily enzyme
MINFGKNNQYFINLVKRIGLAYLVATLCRLVFYIYNIDHFSGNVLNVFFQGLRFDSVTISYLFSLFILLSLLPIGWQKRKWYQQILQFFFSLGIIIMVILNMYDTISFHFTLKRSTADVFDFVSTGNEAGSVFFDFVIDNWYLGFVVILIFWITIKLYHITRQISLVFKLSWKQFSIQFGLMILGLLALVLGARGGLELKPINIIEASRYVKPQYAPLVLNTPFTIAKTLFKKKLSVVNYLPEEEVDGWFKPEFSIKSDSNSKPSNVVVIILESFAKEYIGYFNKERKYTPFLDSLMNQSLVFTDAYASGQLSMDAMPAIFASVPDIMSRSYILSNYCNNVLPGLGTPLKESGYFTSFFHGGENGTMGIDGLVRITGIDNYYGLKEYPKERRKKDFDGDWGIYDEPFMQFYAQELSRIKQPFFSSLFTLSSHYPYTLPSGFEDKFPKGKHKIMELVAYTDYSLQQFFDTIKNEEWYQNTLFILTADHTAQPIEEYYKTKIGKYSIPMVFYTPDGSLQGEINKVVSHVDIMPTVLDYLSKKGKYFGFGRSMFEKEDGFAIQLEAGMYQYVDKDFVLYSNGRKLVRMYKRVGAEKLEKFNLDDASEVNKKRISDLSKKISAYVQQYNNSLIQNRLFVKE